MKPVAEVDVLEVLVDVTDPFIVKLSEVSAVKSGTVVAVKVPVVSPAGIVTVVETGTKSVPFAVPFVVVMLTVVGK